MIARRFIDWSEAALPVFARDVVEERGEDGRLDLSELVLVFPGRRAARRTTELLVMESERRGLSLTPPRSTTHGAFPEMLYLPDRPVVEPLLARRIWSRVLRDRPPSDLEVVAPDPPEPSDLPAWTALAHLVHRLHEELSADGHSFRDVAEVCREGGLSFDDSRRWEVLADVQDEWYRRLDDLGRRDRARARRRALDRGAVDLALDLPSGARGEMHLVGLPELRSVPRAMIRAAAENGVEVLAWIHAPEEVSDRFDDLGCVRPSAWAEADVPVHDEALAVRDTPAEQASEALRALVEHADRYAPDDVTVGVPDRTLVPWIAQRFTSYEVPHRDAAGISVERTRPFRLLEGAGRFLQGRRFADLAILLRHPDVEQSIPGGKALEVADAYFTRHLPAEVDIPLTGDSRDAERLTRVLDGLFGEEILGPLAGRDAPRKQPLSRWMPLILGLLERIYGEEPLRPDRSDDRRLLEACRCIRDVAARLHRLPPAVDEVCSASAALQLLVSELRQSGAAVPPEPDRAAVEMLGWLELHLDDAPALILTGANEGSLPRSVNADLFLPDRLRSLLGLRDNRTRYARDAYLLTAILHARDEVRMVAGRRDGRGVPLRPSRLLLTGEGRAVARRILRFLDGEDDDGVSPLPRLGHGPDSSSSFTVPPEAEIPLEKTPERFRVTEFRTLLSDPYRWALEHHLGLRELDDRGRELDPLGFGSLAHEVLDRFGRSDDRHSGDPERIRKRLDEILDRVGRARFGRSSLSSVPIQLEQLRARLHAFAEWQASWTARGWRIRAIEAAPPHPGVAFEVDGRPVHLHGRIDRLDVHEETGEIAVLDYKTGDGAADPDTIHRSADGTWRDLQLPLYRHLVPHLAAPDGDRIVEPRVDSSRIRLGYVRLSRDQQQVDERFLDWEPEALSEADEQARALIRALRSEDAVAFDPARTTTSRWDPLGPLLGRGILSLEPDIDGEVEG